MNLQDSILYRSVQSPLSALTFKSPYPSLFRWRFKVIPVHLRLLSYKQHSSEGEPIKTVTMRFFQLLLKVANHAALLAPTVKQSADQQEKVCHINLFILYTAFIYF